jgi:predicted dehydrogenase
MGATVIHILDAALWVIGMPEPVTVSGSTNCRIDKMPVPPIHFEGQICEVTVEDFGHAHVRFVDGSSMSIEGELADPSRRTGDRIREKWDPGSG